MSGTESGIRVVLLGPQRYERTVPSVAGELFPEGRVATITAGWQEWEGDDRALDHDPWPLSANAGRREGTLLWHYLTIGLAAGIEPVEFFDSLWYLAQNPDLKAAFRLGRVSTPLAHFLRDGNRENRRPGPDFDGAAYLEANPPARALAEKAGAFGAFVQLGGVVGRVAA